MDEMFTGLLTDHIHNTCTNNLTGSSGYGSGATLFTDKVIDRIISDQVLYLDLNLQKRY